jgi:predicted acetyltransferase
MAFEAPTDETRQRAPKRSISDRISVQQEKVAYHQANLDAAKDELNRLQDMATASERAATERAAFEASLASLTDEEKAKIQEEAKIAAAKAAALRKLAKGAA